MWSTLKRLIWLKRLKGTGEIDPPPEGYLYLANERNRILKDETNALIIVEVE